MRIRLRPGVQRDRSWIHTASPCRLKIQRALQLQHRPKRPQDLRQKGNDYEAYLKSTLGPQVVDLLTRLEEAVEFVPDGTIRRPADPKAWLATDLARQTYEAENSVLR